MKFVIVCDEKWKRKNKKREFFKELKKLKNKKFDNENNRV